ncbi:hypothetical protein NW841_12475 [Synechococcus sp. H60.3]|uniref:hypothetical protein n=1 Tax=Synechococcus sp. H60.3 TaxID=2967124 RepID=UPI0039C0FE75
MMNENNKEQGELLAKLAAVGLGAIVGGAIGGPIGAAVGAAAGLGFAELRLAENLPKPEPPEPPTRLPSLVVLASRASQFREYFSHLSPGQKITEKNACELLYKNSKYIWRGTQKEFEALKEEVEKFPAENLKSAFYLVALEADEDLPGLARDTSPLERRDAFLALCSKAKIVWISPPLHLNSFANKDFYLV